MFGDAHQVRLAVHEQILHEEVELDERCLRESSGWVKEQRRSPSLPCARGKHVATQ